MTKRWNAPIRDRTVLPFLFCGYSALSDFIFLIIQMMKPPLLPRLIATGFGSGFSPFAPGTAGALLATLLWWMLPCFIPVGYIPCVTLGFILLFGMTGIWATRKLQPFWGEDPSKVVVDEMVGVWIALLAAPAGSLFYALSAFALFRLFDIFKPLGIKRMEKYPGGVGVMMDDVLAGIYSFLILLVARWLMS